MKCTAMGGGGQVLETFKAKVKENEIGTLKVQKMLLAGKNERKLQQMN